MKRGRSLLVALSAVLFLLPAVPARAATVWFVDNRNAACNDAGPGSEATPFCTIQQGARKALTGDTVEVHPGTYSEQVSPVASGTAGSPITYRATGPGVVVLGTLDVSDPGGWSATETNAWSRPYAPSSNPTQVFLDGTRLARATGSTTTTTNSFFYDPAARVLYVDIGGPNPGIGHLVEAGARTYGFNVVGLHDLVIEGFTIKMQNVTGARAFSSSSAVTMRNLNVSYTGSYGIHAESDPQGPITIEGNEVSWAGSNGIRLLNSSNVTVSGNASHHNLFHGIALQGSSNSLIIGNTSFANAKPSERAATGIDVNGGSSSNVIQNNTTYANQDSGIEVYNGSNGNLVVRNVSYANGDHGFDTFQAIGTRYVSNSSYGNFKDGFSAEGNSFDTTFANNIAVDNGLTTNEFDLFVAADSATGASSDYNIFWNSAAGTAVKFNGVRYMTLADYAAATENEAHGIGADPRFVDAAGGDLHITFGSPAIDSADAGASGFVAPDHDGFEPADVPSVPDMGSGIPPYADRGAYEYAGPIGALTVSPDSGRAPLPLTADASASTPGAQPIDAYTFTFGDGTTVGPQAAPTADHTYPEAGTYQVTVTVRDAGGLTSSASRTVIVDQPAPPPTISASPRDVRDASKGTETNMSDPLSFEDGLILTTGAFGKAYASNRYLDFVMNTPLRSGTSVAGAQFSLKFASVGGKGSGNACMYFEVRRTSTGAVIGTHGSPSSPLACSNKDVLLLTTTSIPEVTASDVANDLTVRVYGVETGGKGWKVDLSTVTGSTPALSFTLYERSFTDQATGTPSTRVWSLESLDASQLATGNWSAAFDPSRYLKLTFPTYAPPGASVSGVTFTNSYRSANAGTTCYFVEVYSGSTLIGTHGSSSSPVSCATSSPVADVISLPEVDTPAEANDLVIKLYVRNSKSKASQHDVATITTRID